MRTILTHIYTYNIYPILHYPPLILSRSPTVSFFMVDIVAVFVVVVVVDSYIMMTSWGERLANRKPESES